jgi:molybdopterin synthase sulfur carrier subunit
MIKVLYFASFRERLGEAEEELQPKGLPDMAAVLQHLRQRGDVWAELFAPDQTVMMAVNQEVADPQTKIKDGDELAFFPPVTGG